MVTLVYNLHTYVKKNIFFAGISAYRGGERCQLKYFFTRKRWRMFWNVICVFWKEFVLFQFFLFFVSVPCRQKKSVICVNSFIPFIYINFCFSLPSLPLPSSQPKIPGFIWKSFQTASSNPYGHGIGLLSTHPLEVPGPYRPIHGCNSNQPYMNRTALQNQLDPTGSMPTASACLLVW